MKGKKTNLWPLLLALLAVILLSPSPYAATGKDDEVAMWAEETLLATLSLDYASETERLEETRKNYTLNAWKAIHGFLGNYMEKVLTDQLILHPAPISPPVIVKSGIVTKSNFFAGVPYWVIQQPIAIPELSITIDFIVVVIELKQKNQYIIQSLNMSIKNSSPM